MASVAGWVQQYTERHTERETPEGRAGYPLEGEAASANDYVVLPLGNTRTDQEARNELRDQNDDFNINNLTDQLLSAIIRMPSGFRTKTDLTALRGVPIGLLIYKLREKCMAYFQNTAILGHLVLVGTFIRFKNRVDTSSEGRPSIDNPDIPYYPKSISQDVDSFYFRQLPLDRVEYNWPFGSFPSDAIRGTTYKGNPRISLIDYMRDFTSSEEGSDMTFFVMGYGSYIFKRFRSFRSDGGYSGPNARYHTRVIRSGGLRQVLYRSFVGYLGLDYTFFVPGGSDGNCFEASLRWCYLKSTDDCMEPDFYKIWYKIMSERATDGDKNGTAEDYERKYKSNGYPTIQMRLIAFSFYWATGYKPELWYATSKSKERWKNLLARDSWTIEREDGSIEERVCHGRLTMFQMEDNGLIRDDKRRKEESQFKECEEEYYIDAAFNGELGRMMHCMGIHPAPPVFLSNVSPFMARGRSVLVKQIEVQTKVFFAEMYRQKNYWGDIKTEDIRYLVEAQLNRYQEKCVNTLIFNPESSKRVKTSNAPSSDNSSGGRDGGGSSKQVCWKLRKWNEEGCKPEYYVVAYDLETVTNTLETHMETPDKVYAPFRRGDLVTRFNSYERSIYDPVENQIPFSSQWIVVNTTDRGDYLKRKYDKMKEQNDIVSTITSFVSDVDSPNGEYFLSNVRTEKGGGVLGKCVEDMLVNISSYIFARGGKHVYCYAHNGAHFDAFVVLQFQRFEVCRILKTSRGVMTVTIRVPITMTVTNDFSYDYRIHDVDTPKVNIILRDTMLHVPGSLARLCKGFNVPSDYCKLDFPIQKVNAKNYDHPALSKLIEDYGENDVKALGVIIVKINDLIGSSPWKPANLTSLKPPIAQFVTCMGMIRESTRLHFERCLPRNIHPQAIDLPALRGWLQSATIGGRVNAYAKTYTSLYCGEIMKAALAKDVPKLQSLYSEMVENHSCMQVLDFTSLYPFAMDSCPMPTGRLRFASVEECWNMIDSVACLECDHLLSLCPKHRCEYNKEFNGQSHLRPFGIIIVKDVGYTQCQRKRNMCGRKSYHTSTQKATMLAYTLEDNAEYKKRKGGVEEIRETQSFTNVDLYWMSRQGFCFTVVGGFTFEVTSVYNLFIGPAFKDRIRAKKEGNKLLSDFLKLNYNGSFGITTQQDITDSFFVTRLDDKFRDMDPRDSEVRNAIYAAKFRKQWGSEGLEACEELTGEAFYLPSGQALFQKRKKEHLSEFFADQSPMQIGAAVLSWSRHIANLVMFNIGEEDQTYTDTDSICINDALTSCNDRLAAMICNRDDAPLGSLKNDHAENNGTEPRIFFSMIGTKKVKCHMTLNQEGKIRIFNTFKGLNVATEINGITKQPDYADYIACKTLLYLNIESSSPPVEVTSWKRDLQYGVSISNHLQMLSPDTYLEECKGTIVKDKCYGTVEFFVPHGCIVAPDYPVLLKVNDNNGGRLECTQGERRKENLVSHVWKGIDSIDLVNSFIEDYYSGVDSEYNPETEDYAKIMKAFEMASK